MGNKILDDILGDILCNVINRHYRKAGSWKKRLKVEKMLKVWLVISGPRFKHNPATYIHFRTNQFTLDTRPHPSLVGWKNEVTLMTAI